MLSFLHTFFLRPDCGWLLALPLVAALAGVLANAVSWHLLWGSVPFLGRYQHGIWAAHAERVAQHIGLRLAESMHLSELFRLMEPEKIAAQASASVLGHLDEYVDAVMTEKYAVLWDNLPVMLRRQLYGRVRRQLPSMLDNLMDDMAEHMDLLVNLPELMTASLTEDRTLTGRLLAAALPAEKRFSSVISAAVGAVLGFGLIGLALYQPYYWLLLALPLVALAAYWVARLALLSGRLRQSSWLYGCAHGLAHDVFTLHHFMRALLAPTRIHRTRSMMRRHFRPLLDAGMVRTGFQLVVGAEGYANIKQQVVDHTVFATLHGLAEPHALLRGEERIRALCEQRLQAQSPQAHCDSLRALLNETLWLQVVAVMSTGLVVGILVVVARSLVE